MNASGKINGYTEEEAKTLVEYIRKGKKSGKTLTALFAAYGAEHGRARGRDRKSTRLNSSHKTESRMPSSA